MPSRVYLAPDVPPRAHADGMGPRTADSSGPRVLCDTVCVCCRLGPFELGYAGGLWPTFVCAANLLGFEGAAGFRDVFVIFMFRSLVGCEYSLRA